MTEQLRAMGEIAAGSERPLDLRQLDQAARALLKNFDSTHGGFGSAPKFPHPMDLRVLLRQYARTGDDARLHAVKHTLDKMARGGIYDHLGGGFARYSTDERWLVPHFEKMLYDNALLASVYLEAFPGDRRRRIRPGGPRDDGLRPEPDDRPRGGLLLDRGRRQRGRGGEVLRLVARRDQRGPRRRTRQDILLRLRRHGAGNWEAQNILNLPATDRPGGQDCSAATKPSCVPSWPRAAPGSWPCATGACRRARTRRSWSRGTA